MEENENQDNRAESVVGKVIKIGLILLLVAAAVIIWQVSRSHESAKETDAVELSDDSAESSLPADADMATLRAEIERLDRRCAALEREVAALKGSRPAASSSKTSAAAATTSSKSAAASSDPVLTLVRYSHDGGEYNAHLSVKNNADQTITSFTGRIIYYDLDGNMLDYKDFTEREDIDPGMTKNFDVQGYNWTEDYAYYRSKASYFHPNNKYKIKFELRSYRF